MKRRIHLLSLALFTAATLATGGCGEGVSPAEGPKVEAGFDAAPFAAKTTGGSIAVNSLDARIASLQMLVKTQPQALDKRQALVDLLLMRTQFLGTFSDFDQALSLAEDGLKIKPDASDAFRIEASVLSAVHRFDDALVSLSKAESLGAFTLDEARATIVLAKGQNLETLLSERNEKANVYPTFKNLTALAAVQAAIGDFEEADASYVTAIGAYHDVSPFPVAWVAFQRGVMWGESAGQNKKARPLYEEAVKRLPQYTVANIHLAELEFGAGEVERAITRLEGLLSFSEDAEPMSRLAQFLKATDPVRATQYGIQAGERYEALIALHPYAFLDHAAEYYLGPGEDPERALNLTLQNLEIRQNDRAYLLAITAAMASGEEGLACTLVEDAGTERASIPLNALLADVTSICP